MKRLNFFLTGFLSLILIFIMPCDGGGCPGDIKCDGVVDGSDLADFANNFGETDCPECIAAPIPATGQQTSYAVGDDGSFQLGVQWPSTRFTDNEDGTVKDKFTGLIWLKNANCFGAITWSEALASCNSLAAGQCGLSDGSVPGDWRLPNVRELHSLIDFGICCPALQAGHPFAGVNDDLYWTSTTDVSDTRMAWNVIMEDGRVGWMNKNDTFIYVWPVRGGN